MATLESVSGGFKVDVPNVTDTPSLPEVWAGKGVELDTSPTYEPGTVTPEPPVVVTPDPTNDWGSSGVDGSVDGQPADTSPAIGSYESADGTSGGSDPVGGTFPDGGWCDTPTFEDPPRPETTADDDSGGTPVNYGDPVGGYDTGAGSYATGGIDGSYSYDGGSSYSYDGGSSYSYDGGSSYSYDGGDSYAYDTGGDYSYDSGGGYSYDTGGSAGWGGGWDWY